MDNEIGMGQKAIIGKEALLVRFRSAYDKVNLFPSSGQRLAVLHHKDIVGPLGIKPLVMQVNYIQQSLLKLSAQVNRISATGCQMLLTSILDFRRGLSVAPGHKDMSS